MVGTENYDNEQVSGAPSTNYAVDDPQQLQQQDYVHSDPSLQPSQPAYGYPVSDPSAQQQQQQQYNMAPDYNGNASLQQSQPASGYSAVDPASQQQQYTILTEHQVTLSMQQSQPAPGYPACQPPMQQQPPPGHNADPSMQQAQPPLGYPAPDQPPAQGPHQQQPPYPSSNRPTWQFRRAGPSPGDPPPPPPQGYPGHPNQAPPPQGYPGHPIQAPPPQGYPGHPNQAPPPQGYPGHPNQTPHSYSQHDQQQYPPPQYGNSSPYCNPVPTRPPQESCYPAAAPPYCHPQQPAPPPPGAPVFASPMRPPQGQPPMTPLTPYNPVMLRPELGPPGAWSSEIFDFLQDSTGCLLTVLSPCVTFGQIAEIVDTGYSSCAVAGVIYAFAWSLGIPCLYSYTYRTKMRRHFNLRADPVDDLIVHLFCELCAISQEYRELVYRGIDPAMGYVMQQDIVGQAIANPVRAPMAIPPTMSMTK